MLAGGSLLRKPTSPEPMFQHRASGMVDHEKMVARRPCPSNDMGDDSMSLPAEHKVLSLPTLLKNALERRLYPNSNLHRKQLCAALGVSGNTVSNWLSGNNEPQGGHLMALIRFFDSSFAQEISQGHVTKITDRRAMEAIRKMVEAQAELTAALGGKP